MAAPYRIASFLRLNGGSLHNLEAVKLAIRMHGGTTMRIYFTEGYARRRLRKRYSVL